MQLGDEGSQSKMWETQENPTSGSICLGRSHNNLGGRVFWGDSRKILYVKLGGTQEAHCLKLREENNGHMVGGGRGLGKTSTWWSKGEINFHILEMQDHGLEACSVQGKPLAKLLWLQGDILNVF